MSQRLLVIYCGWNKDRIVVRGASQREFFDQLDIIIRKIIADYPGFQFGELQGEDFEAVKAYVDSVWREEKMTDTIVRAAIPRSIIPVLFPGDRT